MTTRKVDSQTLATAVGHYMKAVSKELVSRGIVVGAVRSCGPYKAEEHAFDDVEGEVSVTAGGAGRPEYVLHWSGVSGWGIGPDRKMPFLRYARWMRAGLLPQPAQVASFCTSFVRDPSRAGYKDAPTYRYAGEGFPDLVRRLAVHTPAEEQPRVSRHSSVSARSSPRRRFLS
ncbi:hypothetical protein ACH5AO_35765 [Streptomyces sp. NPDC018964]|uniref:hypothetical protein n=1 Tax=unclassified Streptomyces TaxID=2593676 RepID=UPI00379D1744